MVGQSFFATTLIGLVLCGTTACSSNFAVSKFDSTKGATSGVPVIMYQTAWVERHTSFAAKPGAPEGSEKICKSVEPLIEITIETLPIGGSYEIAFDPSELGSGEFALTLNDNGTLKAVSVNSDPQFDENLGAVTEFIKSVVPLGPFGISEGIDKEICQPARKAIERFAPYVPGEKNPQWVNKPTP